MNNITDYHNFCDINTTKEEREKLNIGNIYSNGAKCNICGYYIRSRNRHDMVSCNCGNIYIDGGSWYAKISFKDKDNFELRTVYFNDIDEKG